MMKDLSDSYIQNPIVSFPPGKLVQARILSISTQLSAVPQSSETSDLVNSKLIQSFDGQVKCKLSMKSSVVLGYDETQRQALMNLVVDTVVVGKVSKVTDFGVFVELQSHGKSPGNSYA